MGLAVSTSSGVRNVRFSSQYRCHRGSISSNGYDLRCCCAGGRGLLPLPPPQPVQHRTLTGRRLARGRTTKGRGKWRVEAEGSDRIRSGARVCIGACILGSTKQTRGLGLSRKRTRGCGRDPGGWSDCGGVVRRIVSDKEALADIHHVRCACYNSAQYFRRL